MLKSGVVDGRDRTRRISHLYQVSISLTGVLLFFRSQLTSGEVGTDLGDVLARARPINSSPLLLCVSAVPGYLVSHVSILTIR